MKLDTRLAAAKKTELPPYLAVVDCHGKQVDVPLVEGETVFAGTGRTCAAPLRGNNVAHFHCMFSLNQSKLWVHHCNAGGETVLNGQDVSSEAELNDGDEICIGDNRITVVLSEAHMPAVELETSAACPLAEVPEPAVQPAIEQIDEQSERLQHQAERYDFFAYDEASADLSSPGDEVYPSQNCDNEELELLRAEIEALRGELSEKDAELSFLKEPVDQQGDLSEGNLHEHVPHLVQRLEELLEELQTSDRRHRELEELLRLSEEANQAEQEERRQLERWVQEIEHRVSQREGETAAEISRIQNRSQEVQEQLKRAEAYIRKLTLPQPQESTQPQVSAELHLELQSRNAKLADQLKLAIDEIERLRIENSQAAQTEGESVRRLEQKIVEMELQSCRERAELARERAEFERARDEFEKRPREKEMLSDSDGRFAVMRQHLRERHEQEQREREEKRRRGLSGRIAALLNRI